MAEDILEDQDMKDLVEEFDKVEGEESVTPESSLEPAAEKPAADPDEPSRELPETDEAVSEVEETSEPQEGEPVDELTQQLTDLAGIYGMPPELLAGRFTSVDDAKAALELLDQSYISSAQVPPEQYEEYGEMEEQEYQQPEEESRRPAAPPSPPQGTEWSELALDNWDEDDDLPKNLKGLDKNTRILAERQARAEEVLMRIEQRERDQIYRETMGDFNSIMDRVGSKLLGSGDSLTPTQEKNRTEVLQTADYMVAGMHARNVDLPTKEQLIERAMQLALKTEIGKERALDKASSRRPRDSRRLGMPSRGTDKSVTEMAMQQSGPLEENQAFLDLYKRLEEEG